MTEPAGTEDSTLEPPSERLDYVGLTIDERYHVLRQLGSGGMGTVVLARHTGLKRLVAIKFVDQQHVSGSGVTERLFREAQTAASIGHPNIIEVLDVGVTSWGNPYLVMEYLQGENLAVFTEREGRLSVAQTCAVLEPVLDGLSAAHELGIVHRDLKPQNIVLARKRGELVIKLIDFGIAKIKEPGLSPLTRSGELVGTPSFMSPEQAKGEEVDARSDVFCVGVLFYRLLTGNNPFAAANYHSLLHRIATAEPELSADIPHDVRVYIERCLAKDPKSRFQTAREALNALSSLEHWSERSEARAGLLLKLRTLELDSDFERVGSSQDRVSLPRISRSVTPTSELPGGELELEQTLAASTPSSAKLRPSLVADAKQRPTAVPLALTVVAVLAFCGGWWLAFYKDRPAAPGPNLVSEESGPSVASHASVSVAAVDVTPTSTAKSEGMSAPPPSTSLAPSAPKPAQPSVAKSPIPQPPPTPSASAPNPANMLGKSGKNSFFSEDFE